MSQQDFKFFFILNLVKTKQCDNKVIVSRFNIVKNVSTFGKKSRVIFKRFETICVHWLPEIFLVI